LPLIAAKPTISALIPFERLAIPVDEARLDGRQQVRSPGGGST
jgi:hypothetical protein